MKHLENFGVEGGPSLTLFYGGGINQQGWCSGENARLPLLWSGINSQTWFHMLVEVVFGSCPCCQSFSPGPPVFFPPQKTNTLNFNLIWKQPTRRATFFIIIIIIIIIIINVIISSVTVFAGVLFVHQPGANHAPRKSVTQVNHSDHTLSTFLRIPADPSMQIF